MAQGKKSYKQKLKDPRWQKKRLKVLERDEFSCVHCKDKETTLHVHHKKYTDDPWGAPMKDLETVCEDCHKIIEEIEGVEEIVKIDNIKWLVKIKRKHNEDSGFYFIYVVEFGLLMINYTEEEGINSFWVDKQDVITISKFYNNG